MINNDVQVYHMMYTLIGHTKILWQISTYQLLKVKLKVKNSCTNTGHTSYPRGQLFSRWTATQPPLQKINCNYNLNERPLSRHRQKISSWN